MASLEQTRNRYPAIIKRPSSTTRRRDKSLYSCGATLIGANPSRPLMHTNICGILITEILLRLTYLVTCSARPQKPIQNTIPVAITPSAALLKESRHSYYFFLTGLSLTISFGLEIVNIYSPIQPYHFFAETFICGLSNNLYMRIHHVFSQKEKCVLALYSVLLISF